MIELELVRLGLTWRDLALMQIAFVAALHNEFTEFLESL